MIKFTQTDSGRVRAGFTDENNDCAVRALAEVTGTSYSNAHLFWKQLGRKKGGGSFMVWLDRYLVNNGDKVFGMKVKRHKMPYHDHERQPDPVTRKPTLKRLNVKTFIQQNPTGRFMIITCNHAKAIVDSEIRDFEQGVYSEVALVYEFKPLNS
jgi:hypothetical protein